MKLNFSVILIVFLAAFILACGNNKKRSDEIIIKGKLNYSNGELITLLGLKPDSIIPLDSAVLNEEGEFIFKLSKPDKGFYILRLSRDNFITLLLDSEETAEILGNCRNLAEGYSVKGSAGSELLCGLQQFTRKNFRKADSLFALSLTYRDSIDHYEHKKTIDSAYMIVFQDQQKYVQAFIKNNCHSLASLIALYQTFGRQKVLNERDHFGYFALLDSTLGTKYPGNGYVMELHERVNKVREAEKARKAREIALDSGNTAPEILLKTIYGQPQPLSSLKGRVVLLFFWAGDDVPSQMALGEFKYIHKKYKSKGFEIYAVSLDKYRQTWEDAVRSNKLSWVHVSDMLGWESPVVKEYALPHIPYTVLIDRDGKITSRGTDNTELAGKLYRIYKF